MLYLTSACSKETSEPGSVDMLDKPLLSLWEVSCYCVIEMTFDMLSEDEQCL